MKIVTVVGARPQFVKAAVVSRSLSAAGIEEKIVHTGQHYDDKMSALFFRELEIPDPAINLGIGSGNHGEQTGRMLVEIEKVLLLEKPDWTLVYGDTNSTLAAALAAAKLHVPVAHVEAGLRSFNRKMPEEINRVLTDHMSEALFAPTATAVQHLRSEGLPESRIHRTGDVMLDAALFYSEMAKKKANVLDQFGLQSKGYALATIHRAENTDDPARLTAIFGAIKQLAGMLPVLLPLHPRTQKTAEQQGLDLSAAGLHIIEAVGYLDMIQLEREARLIVTDSGGVQKEAFFYNVPCVTLRDETEWTELVDAGWNRLAPPADESSVSKIILGALEAPLPARANLYGDGTASKSIATILLR